MITEDQHWTAKVIKGNRGGSKDFEKRGGAGGGHSMLATEWPRKKNLSFRWSKKAKITLETKSFWRNIFIKTFKFSPFLYKTKACR